MTSFHNLNQGLKQLPTRWKTRFAPSPTGHLHLGHVLSAIFTWGIAQRAGGQVIIRIEDHDLGRSREEYIQSIWDDLQWLGFVDSPATINHDAPIIQSISSTKLFHHEINRLKDRLYYCRCSRKDIVAAQTEKGGLELRYPNSCRDKGYAETKDSSLRLILDDEVVSFNDLYLGKQSQHAQLQCGDLLIQDRHRYWSYQFAVTVDDLHQGIDLVIRGQDLLSSTGRQMLLARMLGRSRPAQFLHHPLIVDDTGKKLSKRDRASGIKNLREQGLSPREVLRMAWQMAAINNASCTWQVNDLGRLFDE